MSRILIVDDSRTMVSIFRVYLSGLGHEFLEAHNGLDAWQMVQTERPDLIITDMVMTPVDGIELCRRVRAAPDLASTRVILMTGTRNEAERERARTSACDAFILKPIKDPEKLKREVQRVLTLSKDSAVGT